MQAIYYNQIPMKFPKQRMNPLNFNDLVRNVTFFAPVLWQHLCKISKIITHKLSVLSFNILT